MTWQVIYQRIFQSRLATAPWNDPAPIRQELFGIERLEQHAESLAAAQAVTKHPPRPILLRVRFAQNADTLLRAYEKTARDARAGVRVAPAAEWLLDNYHLVEEQIRQVKGDLSPGYYKRLPKLAEGPFAGYPRVFGIAWAYVAHTDSNVDVDMLRRFILAYQHVQPLTIGELWAVAITLRIVLVENLRRLVDRIEAGNVVRAQADALADRLLDPAQQVQTLDTELAAASSAPLSERFSAQLAKRLRDQDPRTTPALPWLESRLAAQGLSIDEVVQHSHQRQGTSNVSVRNVITSLRLVAEIDWAEFVESVSHVEATFRQSASYASMDFATRNRYRNAVEELALYARLSEVEIAERVVAATLLHDQSTTSTINPRRADLGYVLVAEGRGEFEREIDFQPPFRISLSRFGRKLGVGGYAGAIILIAFGLVMLSLVELSRFDIRPWQLVTLALLGWIPASQLASHLVNRAVNWNFPPYPLPALDLSRGVPSTLRTLVAVPTLLTTLGELTEQIERLEIHYLSGADGDLTFALVSDGVDADTQDIESDAVLLNAAAEALQHLNARHGPGPSGPRFLLLHRRRVFNASEGTWMGWERKRGKLHELNRLLRGATDTSFIPLNGAGLQVPSDVRYVITLDGDTQLPRDAANKLIGKIAHPLNQARVDQTLQRVTAGYGILQPRITPALPIGQRGSIFQRVSSGPAGIDPYAAAISDVYQDLFSEGSYTGKGIYDIDAFEMSLLGRIPENRMLSHDLFEGTFARAGLVSDVELVEEFPSRYDVVSKRQARWIRGDWQLLPWILSGRSTGSRIPALGIWKMLDNLRRSLVAPTTLLSIFFCWSLPASAAPYALALVLAALMLPGLMHSLELRLPRTDKVPIRHHLAAVTADARLTMANAGLLLVFLADQASTSLAAIATTIWRMAVSQRHFLQWTTAAATARAPRPDAFGFYQRMASSLIVVTVVGIAALYFAPGNWLSIAGLVSVWLLAPWLAARISRAPAAPARMALSTIERQSLRLTGRTTWRFFEAFVTAADHMLPPDNFQEEPTAVLAHRTSPTNIGLYLLSAVSAHDFGWIGLTDLVERIESTFTTLRQLARYQGHFFNWYGTADLRTLEPAYISSVDSGNLAGHLIALANACEEYIHSARRSRFAEGAADALTLAIDALDRAAMVETPLIVHLRAVLQELADQLAVPDSATSANSATSTDDVSPRTMRLTDSALILAERLEPRTSAIDDLRFWIDAVGRTLRGRQADLTAGAGESLGVRLQGLADEARTTALAMDFKFLLDPERKLLSIGFSVPDNKLDPSCYDLLASEARLASLFAIAKGDAPTRHWFRLGRAATPIFGGAALISWSGSMFEYLMPSLVMRAPLGSLLEQTNRLVVDRQEEYARGLGIPWGISESAYNARDLEFTYQYSNFGVPGLGFKRGLADNRVIAPYATGLATMVYPHDAVLNYARLASLGAAGRYGFYEAIDYTRSRLQDDEPFSIIHNFMSHHQGMTIVAIANTLDNGTMRSRFHREPMIQACELLLQERLPRDVEVPPPRGIDTLSSTLEAGEGAQVIRRLPSAPGGALATQLLTNGRYRVMLTATGAGYSRWGDIAVTRWREDATRDHWGSFVMLRDKQRGEARLIGSSPNGETVFHEDHVAFNESQDRLETSLEIVVSGEDDGEVRRASLTNKSRQTRDIEVTSYVELVLTTPATDNAHQAFAKMFVQTEYVSDFAALLATRRPRSADETPVWAAHFTVVEGDVVGGPQYETDRARFIGRGNQLATAAALLPGAVLSNTVGTVLDPIFSIRQTVRIKPGQTARVAFWTVIAKDRAALSDLIDKHHDRSAFERAKTLAWTQAQVELRHLAVEGEEAADFQRLATAILYADPRFRAPSDAIVRGAAPQSSLWQHSISGDLPIVLLRIDDIEDMAQVRQLLRAHEYWRIKGLWVDLVIINERASSYVQDLQVAIETAVRSSQTRPGIGPEGAKGTTFVLRADLLSVESRALLQAIARVALVARRGPLALQLTRIPDIAAQDATSPRPVVLPQLRTTTLPQSPIQRGELEFFNGLGGFANLGREYLTVLGTGQNTPAPWINVISNRHFGFQVSAEGSGYTWSENSRENQLTPWSNDPVCDPVGEAIYVRDQVTGALWSPTAQPIRHAGEYIARHGFGYSRFERAQNEIALELLQYVAQDDPIKISRLLVTNRSPHSRRLSLTFYAELVLGSSRTAAGPFVTTDLDAASGAMFATNPWNASFNGRVAFSDLKGEQTSWTGDRAEFIGRGRSTSNPLALSGSKPLSGHTGAGLDPAATLQVVIDLKPSEQFEQVWLLGQAASAPAARELLDRYRHADLDAVLNTVKAHWQGVLGAVQVKTPDRSMDVMLNGWLMYQALACRMWARSAFYQASGAFGFRDQLQDSMALSIALPAETRHHLLRACARQFVEGDVQHWWLPQSGQGVRTRISDDRVWLAFAVASYVRSSGDVAVLDESVHFLDGPPLPEGESDSFFQPMTADLSASVFEHCARGLDQCITLTGALGLPLMGSGDWNDGMNRVGAGGQGESVWLAWLAVVTIDLFAPIADSRDAERAQRWRAYAVSVRQAIEQSCWDGAWYRRATFDDGSWLGSDVDIECKIDSIAQSWAVLSGIQDKSRATAAMQALKTHLIRKDDGVALLFTPAFNGTAKDPGYIKGYPPGLRENGGQYSHAAMWAVLAFAELGDGDQAVQLFSLLNPINHARDPQQVDKYKVEPYVVAADVYSVAPHVGRGGWTWYTGSAAWMYRAGVEGILGIRREGKTLCVQPRLPGDWPGFNATITIDQCRYEIVVKRAASTDSAARGDRLDGVALGHAEGPARLPIDGTTHLLELFI